MHADTVLYNARIVTLDAAQPQAASLAIRDGKVLALAADNSLRGHVRPGGEAIDLQGRTALPGLIDAHVHLSWYADYLHNVDLRPSRSAAEAAQMVAIRANTAPAGSWIRGHGWSQENWPGRAFPKAAELDALIPGHPVYLTTQSAHAAWANSLALKMAGVNAATADPPGGAIARDEEGRPSGMLFETAMHLVSRAIPSPTAAQLADRIQGAVRRAHRGGLTGVHDFDGALAFRAYQILQQRGELSLRIVKNLPVELLDQAIALGLRWGFGSDFLRIGGIKTFADGALGPRTAWMIAPYEGEAHNTGICVTDPEEMTENVRKASLAGLPSTIHAIGDRAVHEVLNAYETVRREEAGHGIEPARRRHRIEHVQLIQPQDVARLAQLKIIASMQPIHAISDMVMADNYWGKRADFAYNIRAQIDAGAALALGSDAPVEAIEPLPNIQAAITRRRPDGSPHPHGWRSSPEQSRLLSLEEALHGFTTGPAYAAGLESRLGRLRPGFLADLVVLDRDILSADPLSIGQIAVLATMVGGAWVYRDL